MVNTDRTEASTTRRIQHYAAAAALAAFPALLVVQAPIDPASGGTGKRCTRRLPIRPRPYRFPPY